MYRPSLPVDESFRGWARAAQAALRHRGPDGEDRVELLNDRAILGHTRLAVIDLEGGKQPLTNEDQTVWLVCNGEIYNYVELREELISRGHRFRTHSDCEVLVHLYEEHGLELVNQLVGMYAFALLDVRQDRLLLARDPFGEKPLYYAPLAGGGVAFASELKALTPLPALTTDLDAAAIAQFLALRYIPAPRTHLQAVRKLRAGEIVVAQGKSGLTHKQYWLPEFSPNGSAKALPRENAVEEIRRRIQESVRLRLRSDVPVGAFLSGGVDSTFIAAAIRELEPGARLRTFCASFDDDELNESPYAAMVAERIASDHHEVHFTADAMLSSFNDLIDHYDEPFADASMFPTFAVCRVAREDCKVMLSGDGGDECFAGYREFFRYYGLHGLRRFPGMNAGGRVMKDFWNPAWRGIGPLEFLASDDWQLLYPEGQRNSVANTFLPAVSEAARAGLEELRLSALHHARLAYPKSVIEDRTQSYLPEQVLVKVDRASMRSALECRAPFLDRGLLEYVHTLPEHYHFERGLGKALLRRALPDWVPDRIRWREKRGFTPPLAAWLLGPLRTTMEEALQNFPVALGQIVDPAPAWELWRRHQEGSDQSDGLFRWLVLSRRCRALRS
jgi:asparagine synthase (glutamine-hydrolysing)